MKKLLLKWAIAYVTRELAESSRGNRKLPTEYQGKPYLLLLGDDERLQDTLYDDATTTQPVTAEPEPERAGRVVEVSPSSPSWQPDQHGRGVIVAEPTAIANERKLKERK